MPPASPDNRPQDARRTQLYKGVLEMALMHLLKGAPQYGLKILDQLQTQAGLELAEGTLYPLLHRLEKAGLILAEWRHEAEASHPRKYYALTPEGATDLEAQLKAWRALSTRLNAFLHEGDA